jgi:hypothetical protein
MTDMTRTTVWSILSEAFQTILHTLQATMPEVRMAAGYSHNDVFPFRAYAEYSKGDQVVDLSLDVQMKHSQIHVFGDIALEGGLVIKALMETVVSGEPCDERLLVTHVKDFALQSQQHSDLIASELSRVKT